MKLECGNHVTVSLGAYEEGDPFIAMYVFDISTGDIGRIDLSLEESPKLRKMLKELERHVEEKADVIQVIDGSLLGFKS